MGRKKHTTRRMYKKRREEKEKQGILNSDFGMRCKKCGMRSETFINGMCLNCTFGDETIDDS